MNHNLPRSPAICPRRVWLVGAGATLAGLFLVTWLVNRLIGELPTEVEDNPARLEGVDARTGQMTITFVSFDGVSQTRTAALARIGGERHITAECIRSCLLDRYHGYFTASLDNTGNFEILVLDVDGKTILSFNDQVRVCCKL